MPDRIGVSPLAFHRQDVKHDAGSMPKECNACVLWRADGWLRLRRRAQRNRGAVMTCDNWRLIVSRKLLSSRAFEVEVGIDDDLRTGSVTVEQGRFGRGSLKRLDS